MKRIVLLATVALVALLMLVPTAMAQDTEPLPATGGQTEPLPASGGQTEPLPTSGGLVAPSVLLPAAALLLGTGVVAYAVLRRR